MINGEKNGRAKTTWELVNEWRERYQREREPKRNQIRNRKDVTGYLSTYMVADFLGISQSAAWAMLNEKTWKVPR